MHDLLHCMAVPQEAQGAARFVGSTFDLLILLLQKLLVVIKWANRPASLHQELPSRPLAALPYAYLLPKINSDNSQPPEADNPNFP